MSSTGFKRARIAPKGVPVKKKKTSKEGVLFTRIKTLLPPETKESIKLLKDLMRDIDTEIHKREELFKKGGEIDKVTTMMATLSQKFGQIEWGSFWKDDKTSDAVRKLGRTITIDHVLDIIDSIESFDNKWEASVLLTIGMTDIVNEALDYGGKLVNGSMGEWCPNMADTVAEHWKQLIDEGIKQGVSVTPEMVVSLGDSIRQFGDYCDHESVLKRVQGPSV